MPPIDRNRDQFLRELIHELAKALEDTVGLEEAEGLIAVVGNRLGNIMNKEYLAATDLTALDVEGVAAALVDLKRRIEGGFSVESMNSEKIVLTNTKCPFGKYVEGRASLCIMTSNVFGRITAENLNYTRVELHETIGKGDTGCRVTVHLHDGGAGRGYYS